MNQLASYISIDSEYEEIEINLDIEELKNKQLAYYYKRQDEWKELKKFIETKQFIKNSTIYDSTIQGIIKVLAIKIEKFMFIVSSK